MMAEKGTDAVERRIVQPCQRYMRAEFTPVGRQAGAQHGIVDLFLQAAEPRARPHPGPQCMDLAAVTEGADAEQAEIEGRHRDAVEFLVDGAGDPARSEERRGGKGGVRTCRSRWAP